MCNDNYLTFDGSGESSFFFIFFIHILVILYEDFLHDVYFVSVKQLFIHSLRSASFNPLFIRFCHSASDIHPFLTFTNAPIGVPGSCSVGLFCYLLSICSIQSFIVEFSWMLILFQYLSLLIVIVSFTDRTPNVFSMLSLLIYHGALRIILSSFDFL